MPQKNRRKVVRHQVGLKQPAKPTRKPRAKKAPAGADLASVDHSGSVADMVPLRRLLKHVAANVGVDGAMGAICEKWLSGELPIWRRWVQGSPQSRFVYGSRLSDLAPSNYELAPPSFLTDLETRGLSINNIFSGSEDGIYMGNEQMVILFASRTDAARFWPWPDDKKSEIASVNVDDTSLSSTRRGRKGYGDEIWKLLEVKFYLLLDTDDQPAHANIDAAVYAEKLATFGQQHPHIGETKTPDEGTIRKKIPKWMKLWRTLKDSNE